MLGMNTELRDTVDWEGVKILELEHEQNYWKRTLEAIWIKKTEERVQRSR